MAAEETTCPVAKALDVVGEKWSLLILRDLLRRGPLRFQALHEGIDRITPSVLSARLKSLEANGIITPTLYRTHPPRYEYRLTDKGKALGPVLKALHNWGERYG